MDFIKNFFKQDDRIIGLCGFRKEEAEHLNVFIPKFNPTKTIFTPDYKKNFFLT